MPLCITGMHRSGTSMIAHVLHQSGLYYGAAEEEYRCVSDENPEGYWENIHFVALNDQILAQLEAGWDLPPVVEPGWETHPRMLPIRLQSAELIRCFDGHEPWGWKDPRCALTLPFWKQLLPDLKVLICIRNPLEVARSLHKRGFWSTAHSLDLWLAYNRRLLQAVGPAQRVISHCDAWFTDAAAEARRVLNLLGMPSADSVLKQAVGQAVHAGLRHHRVTTAELTNAGVRPDVLQCYMDLCAEAGPVYQASLKEDLIARLKDQAGGRPTVSAYRDALLLAQWQSRVEEMEKKLRANEDRGMRQDMEITMLQQRLATRRYRVADWVVRWLRPARKSVQIAQGWLAQLRRLRPRP
jgi:hypothetical protein